MGWSVFKRAQSVVCGCLPAGGEHSFRACCFRLWCKPEEHSRERITCRERGGYFFALFGPLGTVGLNKYGADAFHSERRLTPLLDVFKVREELRAKAREIRRAAIRFVEEVAALLSGGSIRKEEGEECVGAMGEHFF